MEESNFLRIHVSSFTDYRPPLVLSPIIYNKIHSNYYSLSYSEKIGVFSHHRQSSIASVLLGKDLVPDNPYVIILVIWT